MKPDEPKSDQKEEPLLPQRSMARAPESILAQSNHDAAANVIRTKINNLYDTQATVDATPADSESATPLDDINPYQRTHTEHISPSADQWKKYHTAWQDYYQRYYENYYTHNLRLAKQQQSVDSQIATLPTEEHKGFFTHQPEPQPGIDEIPTTEEAMFDLRQQLLGRVQESAKKAKQSRHFMPILSGVVVVIIFLFLQYNRVLIANVSAYISPGNIDPQNIIIDPNSNFTVSPES